MNADDGGIAREGEDVRAMAASASDAAMATAMTTEEAERQSDEARKRARDPGYDEIPADVLAEAMGARRSGRKTKARVIMIDGEPVLRSNNYTLTEGEPSVFDKELEASAKELDDGRTQYVFEEKRDRKPYVRRKPKEPKVQTDNEVRCVNNNREVAKAMEAAVGKRAKYLDTQMKALEPFITPQVKNMIHERAAAHEASQKGPEKILLPVENQPAMIKAVLREYQLEGLRWNVRMFDQGTSCILADEMGLGKTLQSISFLACIKEMRNAKGPHLVVCPLSVLSSWMDELQKWAPSFRVVRLHSGDETERARLRKEVVPNTESYDVAVTTYEMACNAAFNVTLTQKVMWRCLILDEGHRVKNEETAAHMVLKRIKRQHTLLLTGTPVQNNLHELYAILSFLHPDLFTTSEPFDKAFNLNTAEHKVDSALLEKAHFLMRPFILRRVKGEVEVSLPPKTETKIMCPLSQAQTFWYRRLLMREATALTSLEKSARGEGGADNFQKLNSLLMQLRKCCNHPFLFSGTDVPEEGVPVEELVSASGKLAVLDRMLTKLKAGGHRVVLFSQFTSMLDILQDFLTLKGYTYARLDGSTNRVQRSIDIAAFNRPDSPMFAFLLSTRAGGLGVNLQTADTCILFDSDWNPQVDLQAMARVHRIGQKKMVHIYRLVTAGTVEERMTQRAEKKLFLEQMVSRGSTKAAEMSDSLDKNDLYAMLRFGVDQVFSKESGDPPTDEELDILMDRTAKGDARRKKLLDLQGDVMMTAEDYIEGKAEAAPISTYMLPTAIANEMGVSTDAVSEAKAKQYKSVKDIAAEFNQNILSTKRVRSKTTMIIDGHTVLKANNYSMEEGEPSVHEREALNANKPKGPEQKKPRSQIAGRDYGHSSVCQSCWDGGEIVCCDLCPVSVHPDCIGITVKDITRYHRWSCPHHSCHECGRKAAAVGGILFRCEACPRAFCEDHLPSTAEIIGKCKRFQDLGQNHPAQACFIHCDGECAKWAATHIADEYGKASEGWSIAKKVAITDHWIEERDAELELPVENGTRTKPLAHATFTDLVQFLLRNEGPKKGGKKKKKTKAVEEFQEPQPGELLEMRGVLCYYTRSGENVGMIAEANDTPWEDIIKWNEGWIEGKFYGKGTYLLEGTRLWLGPPPRKTLEELPEEERAMRIQEEREAAIAAAAMGLPGASTMLNEGEVCVLGRGLKSLRQKDLLPSERDEIVSEMFKRVRPLLEKKIDEVRKQEEDRKAREAKEAEKERYRQAERNARTARRGDGMPVDTFFEPDEITAGDRMPSRRGGPPPMPAPHGGELAADKLDAIRNIMLRGLDLAGASPNATYLPSMMLKVRLARGHAGSPVIKDMRTRWTSKVGEDIGFNLAVISLERDGLVELELHHKYPENIELASLRLTSKAKVPPKTKGEASQEAPKESRATNAQSILGEQQVKVQCGHLDGVLRPGAKRGDETVEYVDEKGVTRVTPAVDFERLGGRGSTRKWRQSIRLAVDIPAAKIDDDSKRGIPIGKYLRDEGAAYRESVIGRCLEMWFPEIEEYFPGEVIGYKSDSGEHEIMYNDGNREWIYFCLQKTRWPDGLPQRFAVVREKPGRKPQADKETTVKRVRNPGMGDEVVYNGYRVYVCGEANTIEAVSSQVGITNVELLEWNSPYFPKLTAETKLPEETKLYLQRGPSLEELEAIALVESTLDEARAAAEDAKPKTKPAPVVVKSKSKAASKVSSKKPPKRSASKKAKYASDDDDADFSDEDFSEEDEDDDDDEDEDDEYMERKRPNRSKYTEEELAAQAAADFLLELDAQCVMRAGAVPIECGGLEAVLTGGGKVVLFRESKKKTSSAKAMDIAAFMKLAKKKGAWQEEVKYNGAGPSKGQPIIHHLSERGLALGRGVIGNNIEILPYGEGMEFFPAKVVAYDDASGEHEVQYFSAPDGEAERVHLFLSTVRWLPKVWEPFTGDVKLPEPDGGLIFALKPIPIGCGGMRGVLLPGGKRGEEMVRYAAMRRERERCTVDEITVPATDFERSAGKGTAKKWRQSIRFIGPDYKMGDNVGKLMKQIGETLGASCMNRDIEIFWPSDESFYYGTVTGFRPDTGEHEIVYDDGSKEILQIAMQTVRWAAAPIVRRGGAPVPKPKAKIAASPAPKTKPKTSWIQCDACEKWRIVPQTYMDTLGDDDSWKCAMNPDAAASAEGCARKEDKE